MKTINEYPAYICADCGKAYCRGLKGKHVYTSHEGRCEICGNITSVTEPRDYGHLDEKKIKVKSENEKVPAKQKQCKRCKKMVNAEGVHTCVTDEKVSVGELIEDLEAENAKLKNTVKKMRKERDALRREANDLRKYTRRGEHQCI